MTIDMINRMIIDINIELYEQTEHDEVVLELRSVGTMIVIDYLGIQIWNSDDDEREIIYEDIYEELEPYIIRKINKISRTLVNIQI